MSKSDRENQVGVFGPMVDGPLLTQDEFDVLPDGTIVQVLWHGGNGPSTYMKVSDRWGNPMVETVFEFADQTPNPYSRHYMMRSGGVDDVGDKFAHHKVKVMVQGPRLRACDHHEGEMSP